MKKVIISGAGGFVGSELTKKMIENNVEVIAVSATFNPSYPESHLIKKICMDIDDSEGLCNILREDEYDAFYHLAWRGVNGQKKADINVQLNNMKTAINCACIAHKLGVKKFLCSGTVAERATESLSSIEKTGGGMFYGVTKYCTHIMLENYCKNIGLNFVWMQFSNIYGPKNKTGNLISYTIGMLTEGKEATFGQAQQPYDFVYVDDLIEAVYRLGANNTSKNYYFIGSGKPRILKEYLLQVGQIYGRPDLIKIGVRPDDGVRYSYEMFDISELKKDIGDYNKTSFDFGIKTTIAGYKANAV